MLRSSQAQGVEEVRGHDHPTYDEKINRVSGCYCQMTSVPNTPWSYPNKVMSVEHATDYSGFKLAFLNWDGFVRLET